MGGSNTFGFQVKCYFEACLGNPRGRWCTLRPWGEKQGIQVKPVPRTVSRKPFAAPWWPLQEGARPGVRNHQEGPLAPLAQMAPRGTGAEGNVTSVFCP